MSKQVTSWTECLVCGLIWVSKTAGESCPVHPVLERESATTKRYEDKLEVAESQLREIREILKEYRIQHMRDPEYTCIDFSDDGGRDMRCPLCSKADGHAM